MPVRITDAQANPYGVPPALAQIVNAIGTAVTPETTLLRTAGDSAEPMVDALGKPISELLGRVFTPTQAGTGLPKRLTLSNWNARTGTLAFHGDSRAAAPVFEATPAELSTLLRSGILDVEQPPAGATSAIRAQLARALGASRTAGR